MVQCGTTNALALEARVTGAKPGNNMGKWRYSIILSNISLLLRTSFNDYDGKKKALIDFSLHRIEYNPITMTVPPSSPKLAPVPDLAAGADAVRVYVSQILVAKYNTAQAVADEAAQMWKFGDGRDFFEASSNDLKSIFGPEVGYIVYRTKRQDWKTKWRASTAAWINSCACGIVIIIISFVCCTWTGFRD